MSEVSLLYDIGLVVVVATVIAVVIRALRQPILLGYIIGGVVIGPTLFNLVRNREQIAILAELGIALLLFLIGMEMDLKRLRQVGVTASAIGTLQVALTAAASLAATWLMGFGLVESIYIALMVSFSSTMIVVKLLSDKNELDSLHGELVLGILIVQDVIAVLAISLMATLGSSSLADVALIILKGVLLFAGMFLFTRFLLDKVLRLIVSSQELLFVGALSVCLVYAELAVMLGYSIAIGAFMAGIALGTTPYRYEITSKVKPLRDFFLILFFVALGMQISLKGLAGVAALFTAILLLVAVVKPLLTFLTAKAFRYGNRTALFAGLQVGQVGEFSLVLGASGVALGQLSPEAFSAITLATMLTILTTAYVIKYDDRVYARVSRFLKPFERKSQKEERLRRLPETREELKGHILLLGTHKMGMKLVKTLARLKYRFVVVDYNPERITELIGKGVNCICSDMTNHELLELLNLREARAVISTISSLEGNMWLISSVKRLNRRTLVIVTTREEGEAMQLYRAGADYVVLPDSLGGEKVSNYLQHLTPGGIKEWGRKHYLSLLEDSKAL